MSSCMLSMCHIAECILRCESRCFDRLQKHTSHEPRGRVRGPAGGRGSTDERAGDVMSRRWAWERRADGRDDDRRRRRARPLPTTAVWRWRYEVIVTSGVSGGVAGLVQVAGAHSTVAIVVATGATAVSVPTVRRVSWQVWWHVVTPHLFRRTCSDLGFRDGHGRLPAVVRTR